MKSSEKKQQETWPRGVAKPAVRALIAAGYPTVNDLAKARAEDLAKLHGMGPKALGILSAALKERGKSFKA